MSKKLAIFCLGLALVVPTLARAENLVDRGDPDSDSDDQSSKGNIFDLFGAAKRAVGGSRPSAAADTGCEVVNAAGNAVYVKRPGCP